MAGQMDFPFFEEGFHLDASRTPCQHFGTAAVCDLHVRQRGILRIECSVTSQ